MIAALAAAVILLVTVGSVAMEYQRQNAWLYCKLEQSQRELERSQRENAQLRDTLTSLQKQIDGDVAAAILGQAERDAFDALTAHWEEDPR